jgi:pimeloyl-ACP methyl ester carboxylesterase
MADKSQMEEKPMRKVLKHLAVVITLALVGSSLVRAQQDALAGNWLARMEYNGITQRLVMKIVANSDGSLTAKLDSLDQGASDLPTDAVTREGETVRFTAKELGLEYEGKINPKGDEITGNLKQGGGAFPLAFRRTAVAPTLGRPQDPAKPYPYHEEEVSYKNERDDVKLAGTLPFPRDGKRHPVVLLITGSGPQDRNETVAGHRPFLVLADALTRAGIAVLRVDDRGVRQQSEALPAEQRQVFASVKAPLEAQMPLFPSAWFRYFIAYDPRPTLEKVKVPVLALNGENDVQVAAKENLALIAAALKTAGNQDYTIKALPKLNHLFQTSATGLLSEYESIEETIAPEVLETITSWVLQRTLKR